MRFLKEGDKGRDVRELQFLLNGHYDQDLKVDGIFGPATAEAVAAMTLEGKPEYGLHGHLELMLGVDYTGLPLQIFKLYDQRIPYIWGGKFLKSGDFNNPYGGLDCSGLVAAVYLGAFNPVMDNAARMWEKVQHVDNPIPGDLVFYGRKQPTHVVILADTNGGIIGMQGGNPKVKKPTTGAEIQYFRTFTYRRDVWGFGRVNL